METDIPTNTDTVQISKNLHFEQIADICGISLEQVKSLNPQYKKSIIPGDIKPYTLRLPYYYINTFIDNQDTIYAHRADELFNERKIVEVEDEPVVSVRAKAKPRGSKTYHKIRNGETLSTIAEKYHVRISDIKKWNNLRGTNIAAGKRLKIYK